MHMVSGPRLGGTGSCYDNAAAESFNTLLQEGGSEPEDLPNTETCYKGCDSLDRVTLQSETTSLGVRVPNPQPRPPTMESKPESSLKILFFSGVHKTHSTSLILRCSMTPPRVTAHTCHADHKNQHAQQRNRTPPTHDYLHLPPP